MQVFTEVDLDKSMHLRRCMLEWYRNTWVGAATYMIASDLLICLPSLWNTEEEGQGGPACSVGPTTNTGQLPSCLDLCTEGSHGHLSSCM